MPQISERWEIQIGKNKHIVSGQEKDLILKTKEMGLNFVKFRDLVINPAFVQDMVLVDRINEQQIEAPIEKELTQEDREANIKRIEKMKRDLKAIYP